MRGSESLCLVLDVRSQEVRHSDRSRVPQLVTESGWPQRSLCRAAAKYLVPVCYVLMAAHVAQFPHDAKGARFSPSSSIVLTHRAVLGAVGVLTWSVKNYTFLGC